MARKKQTYTMTSSTITNPCLHAVDCPESAAIQEAVERGEIEVQTVSAEGVAQIRAGGTFVDSAGCMEGK